MYPTKDVPKQSPLFAFCAIDPRWHWGRHHACTQSPQSSMHPKSVLFMGTNALTAMIATFSPVTYRATRSAGARFDSIRTDTAHHLRGQSRGTERGKYLSVSMTEAERQIAKTP